MIARSTIDLRFTKINACELFRSALLAARPRLIRTMVEAVEESLVIPEGNFRGQRYRFHRQPFNRLLFEQFDAGQFNTFAVTGCVQSGKTLSSWVFPIVYHLFERQESVIAGVPTMDVAGDKYREEILPVIMANPEWRGLLPEVGSGSRGGGKLESVKFLNGATLKFMSGRGRDEKRSSFTSRVVCCTETDKFDEAGSTSREADPITQLINRTSSFGQNRRIYLECTVSIKEGRIWQEYQNGTASKIVCPCVHCGEYVRPEREHFVEYQQPDILTAGDMGHFICPSCKATITEDDRKAMNADGKVKLIHKGQTITKDGTIHGDAPRTNTLGFRWNAFDNVLMWPTNHIAMEEFRTWRSDDDVSAEKESSQFRWTKPFEDTAIQTIDLKIDDVTSQKRLTTKSVIPDGTKLLTIGTDVGGKVLHWTVMAWLQNGRGHVVDYGTTGVLSQKVGFEQAIIDAAKRLHDRFKESYAWDLWYFDSHWKSTEVFNAIRGLKDKKVRGLFGLGSAQVVTAKYHHPRNPKGYTFLGTRMYERYRKEYRAIAASCDADYWKNWLHEAFTLHLDESESDSEEGDEAEPVEAVISLFDSTDETEHVQFAKHLTAEKQVKKFVKDKGDTITWTKLRSQNHWLDSTVYACVAAHRCGFVLATEQKANRQAVPTPPASQPATPQQRLVPVSQMDTGGDRPFMVTDR